MMFPSKEILPVLKNASILGWTCDGSVELFHFIFVTHQFEEKCNLDRRQKSNKHKSFLFNL